MDVKGAQDKIGGWSKAIAIRRVRELAHRFGVEMPITEEIYQVLYCGKTRARAALTLLGRPQGRAESPLAVGTVCIRAQPAQNGLVVLPVWVSHAV